MGEPQMKRPLLYIITFLAVISLVQASCASTTVAAPTATLVPPTLAPVLSIPTDTPTAAQSVGGPLYVVIDPPGEEYADLQDSFIKTANGLGADALKYDDAYDPQAGMGQVNDDIKAGAKGIAIQAFAPNIIGPAISKAAKAAGVVLIAIEAPIKDGNGKALPLIGVDEEELGKQAGETAAKLLSKSGWLKDSTKKVGILSLEVKSQPFCNLRTDNEKAVIKSAGVSVSQIFPLQYDNIKVDSQDTTGPILRAHPDITNWVVFGCTDFGIAGSLQAFAAAGVKTEDIIAIGIGISEACIPWAAGQPTGFKATVFISNRDIGRMAAIVLNDAVVNGKTPPPLTLVPPTVVDPSNFKTLMDPVSLAKCG